MSSFNYTIAIDAMGGEHSPSKVIQGISLFLKEDKEIFFNIFGKESLIIKEISQYKNILPQNYKIINCETQIEDKNSVRDAIKVGKNSSMWNTFRRSFVQHAILLVQASS